MATCSSGYRLPRAAQEDVSAEEMAPNRRMASKAYPPPCSPRQGETEMDRARRQAGDRRLWRAGAGVLYAILVLGGYTPTPVRAEGERPAAWAQALPNVPGLPNLYKVTSTLYRAAQPLPEGLAYLGDYHPLEPSGRPVKTVLSLRALHDDARLVPVPSSVRYEQIRFKAWHPENEDIVKFLRIVTTPALQPVLVHCQHGSDRTGMMVAVYRIVVQGWSKAAALREMTQGGYGFHPLWRNLTRYVMQLDVSSIEAEVAQHGPWP